MSRRKGSVKRPVLADARYDSQTVSKFINAMMLKGKKSTAERIFYGAMDLVESRTNQPGVNVFKQALANLKPDDLACIIPHQANLRIIEAIAHRMGLPMDRFMVNLDRYGNTSAAAVAIALDEAHRTGRMQVGDYVLLVVFGGGLTWASSVIQW